MKGIKEKKKLKPFIFLTVILALMTIYMINNSVQIAKLKSDVLRQYMDIVEKYNDLIENYNELANYLGEKQASRIVGLSWSIHMRIRMWKLDQLILDEYHSGSVTNIGDNMTLAWIFGDSDYPVSDYMDNATYISIGNQGSLSTSSTQLPGEWNRTLATVEDEIQSQLNLTCTFYPDSGPYTADCIGINWESSGDGNLWAYDTFTEVTGIDDTFTINVEFQIGISHS